MKDDADPHLQADDDQTLEGTPQPGLDLIIQHWICIAALAWIGSLVHGPGAITLTIDDNGTQPSYRLGSPCPCHPIAPDSYDPREQVVIVTHRDAEASTPIIVSGWPPLPDAHAIATAEMMGDTVH